MALANTQSSDEGFNGLELRREPGSALDVSYVRQAGFTLASEAGITMTKEVAKRRGSYPVV
jgi:hypothetical protein